jgi:hypothetical protein
MSTCSSLLLRLQLTDLLEKLRFRQYSTLIIVCVCVRVRVRVRIGIY